MSLFFSKILELLPSKQENLIPLIALCLHTLYPPDINMNMLLYKPQHWHFSAVEMS